MKFETVADAEEFLVRSTSLVVDEARHNLFRGILGNVIERPDAFADHKMFLVVEGDRPLCAALLTQPYNLIIADTACEQAMQALVAGVREQAVDVPGVIGNQPTVDNFVQQWRKTTGETCTLEMVQGVFALDRVVAFPPASGSARLAMPDDAELIERWVNEFMAEALPNEPSDDERLRRSVERGLSGSSPHGYWLWEDGERPVSMSGHGSPTGTGIRIGAVYTPKSERRNGYAGALVAAQSQWLLDEGYRFCFLFTDLSNPTSNAIYERIGYRQVAEAASYSFGPSVNPAT